MRKGKSIHIIYRNFIIFKEYLPKLVFCSSTFASQAEPRLKYLYKFYFGQGISPLHFKRHIVTIKLHQKEVYFPWHTRLLTLASAAVLARLSAPYPLSLRATASTRSTLTPASSAVPAPAFARLALPLLNKLRLAQTEKHRKARLGFFPAVLFCTPAGSNSLATSAKANRTDKLPYPHKPACAGRCGGNSRSLRSLKCGRNLRFPLTPSENAGLFWVLTLRSCAPHFFIGGLSPS